MAARPLDERTAAVLEAVRHAHDAGNVHLELTAMLFAMSDLLEQGRMAEHLAMLDEFTAACRRAARRRCSRCTAMFQRASHALSAGDYAEARRLADDALAAGRRSHGVNAEVAYAGVWFRLALDLGRLPATLPESERMLRRQPAAADVADRRRARPSSPPAASTTPGSTSRTSSALDGVQHARQPDVPPGDVHARRGARWPSTIPTRAAVVRRALEPYADRIATSGLAGISIGPVSDYVGLAAEAAGDLDAAARLPARRHRAQRRRRHPAPRGAGPPRALARVLAARRRRRRGAAEEAATAARSPPTSASSLDR